VPPGPSVNAMSVCGFYFDTSARVIEERFEEAELLVPVQHVPRRVDEVVGARDPGERDSGRPVPPMPPVSSRGSVNSCDSGEIRATVDLGTCWPVTYHRNLNEALSSLRSQFASRGGNFVLPRYA
jgi:hypothetical protein